MIVLGVLGVGTFGKVYKVCINQEELALKVFQEQEMISPWEIEILSKKIPGVLYALEKINYKNNLALLLPLALCDLYSYIKKKLSLEEKLYLANSVCYSLLQLHLHGYYHLDIKLENFLVFPDKILLADFSLSRSNEIKEIEDLVVTQGYRPPELDHPPYSLSDKIDSFSLGVLLLEIFTQERVFLERKRELLKEVPLSYASLVSSLLESNPEKRTTLLQLYNKTPLQHERRFYFNSLSEIESYLAPLHQLLKEKRGTWKNFAQVITLFSQLKRKSLDKLHVLVKLVLQLEEIYLTYPVKQLNYFESLELEILIELKTLTPQDLIIPYPHLVREDLDRKI